MNVKQLCGFLQLSGFLIMTISIGYLVYMDDMGSISEIDKTFRNPYILIFCFAVEVLLISVILYHKATELKPSAKGVLCLFLYVASIYLILLIISLFFSPVWFYKIGELPFWTLNSWAFTLLIIGTYGKQYKPSDDPDAQKKI